MRGNFRMALSGIRGSKWRSLLTMLGIIVGIVAVVTVFGIGEGVKRQVAGTLHHFGKELLIIKPGKTQSASPAAVSNADGLFGLGGSTGLSTKDVQTVREVSGVQVVSPLGVVSGLVQAEGRPKEITVLAASKDLPAILNQKVAFGEFWDKEDETAKVAVIGQHVADAFFDEPVPLGRSFTFRGETFLVRGIFEDFNAMPFSPTASFDNAIFIPYQTATELTNNTAGLYVILAKPDRPEHVAAVKNEVAEKLRTAHGGQQDFTVMHSDQTVAAGGEVIRLLTLWICAVAAISLFIGGVGIMNIMLLTVTERMHEIGVRKAIGASSRQILGQFVLEATVLSVVGGIVGIVLSLGVVGLLYAYTDLKPVISWTAIAVAAAVSLAIGIIFGTIPAVKAARKDPIEALRHE